MKERVPSRYKTSDFDYEYPREAVAQRPLPERNASRLLVLHRDTGTIEHRSFGQFASLPDPGDVLVLNESKVMRARLKGLRDNGREAEILLAHPEPDGTWLAMVHPGGKLKVGRKVTFGDHAVAEIVDVIGGGLRRVRFSGPLSPIELMKQSGSVPLPPYIERIPDDQDRERYQTVFAQHDGSVAAPTAGLHFTEGTLSELKARGVTTARVVLHVGPGTFKPVATEEPTDHSMHSEWYSVPAEAANLIVAAKKSGKRVWAVGTTSARVLETVANFDGQHATTGWTDLFIYPPFEFKVVNALLTNFHLPRSTLLMLVAAFAGYESTMFAYRTAVRNGYRLYSYGDAMVVV
ncbi:MAG: tRNA preQ1(34) S-adenosylmethionine ribosyltransferase-isomerase QueA [Gemmatimonadales bacterium]